MVAFPNAKVNLGLKVLGRRPDGFHDIETVLFPVALCDALEIIPAADGIFSLTTSGLTIPGDPDRNLCTTAYRLLAKDLSVPSVKIHLHKVIPSGAGLGGGSSDGAFTIRLLNELFSLGLSGETMRSYAARLGSDCPFFIDSVPALAEGRGELLTHAALDLSSIRLVIVVPNVHVDTKEAYQWLGAGDSGDATGRQPYLLPSLAAPVGQWKTHLFNDFEPAVFSRYPEIREIREMLYSKGALYASMTGSGAAVYGVFREEPEDLSDFEKYFFWSG